MLCLMFKSSKHQMWLRNTASSFQETVFKMLNIGSNIQLSGLTESSCCEAERNHRKTELEGD